jgi:DNA-binding NarL/FixJ family response regulator
LQAQLTAAQATIAQLSQGNQSQLPKTRAAERNAGKLDLLSPRERDVVRLFLKDPCDKKVARLLGTKPQTVRNQISSIEKKLGVASREELVICLLAAFDRTDKET